jgi:predicted metalloprotease
MTDIDSSKKVYLFLHGRMDLHEKTMNALANNGFQKENVAMADPKQAGEVGDYMAMLWMPPNPDHIKIQKITAVEDCEPEGMIGVWKGVAKDDLFEIKLE